MIVTVGEDGALIKTATITEHVAPFGARPVLETTDAGMRSMAGGRRDAGTDRAATVWRRWWVMRFR